MKKIILIALFLGATNLIAQQQLDSTFVNKIKNLETKVNQQQGDIQKLYSELNKEYRTYQIVKEDLNQTIITKQQEVIDSLNTLIEKSNQQLMLVNERLNSKIQETDESASTKISTLDSNLSKNRWYWIIATLVILLIGVRVYWLLGKNISSSKTDVENQIKNSKTDVETQIRNTKASIEEESVKLDSKLMEVLDTQLKLKDLSQSVKPESEEKDHKLVLKVADEVTRILMNLEVMDKNIKGYKHLKKYSESILDNLKAYGYEIPQLMGQNYNSGMNMVATLEFDDNVAEGMQVIKRIIKPQINYNGKMIQAAKVTVAFNE